ncbi:MAG: hypothetical protein HY788_22455 [Deltaproteobacteria bacterium]|nr:hypothetical protein [Deltaproteobacteria bacterium]
MTSKRKYWEHRGCRETLTPGEPLYPGRRVCHNRGGSICVGSLEYAHPDVGQLRTRSVEGQLQGCENVYEIRLFVNEAQELLDRSRK